MAKACVPEMGWSHCLPGVTGSRPSLFVVIRKPNSGPLLRLFTPEAIRQLSFLSCQK